MSRFKFGEIQADVNRLGPVAESPHLEAYSVRLSAPDKASWIESRVESTAKVRSSGSDFLLAALLLAELESAARDPGRWAFLKQQTVRNISSEELRATIEMAQRLEPYLEQAVLAAHDRYELYSEHREGGIGPLEMGIARQLQLPEHIGLPEEVADFFAYLYLVDRTAFHPDDDFNTYVDRSGKRTYSEEEAELRNNLMFEAFQAVDVEGIDIYELGLWVQGLINGDEELSKDAPAWLVKQSKTWV
jgi:hypothetical protein